MNLSKEKNSEYDNLQILMSRLERWCHDLYPKFPLDATLQKIESMGTKTLVRQVRAELKPKKYFFCRNTIKRIRLNELNEQLDNESDAVRRGDLPQSADVIIFCYMRQYSPYELKNAFDDQLNEFDNESRKRALSDPEQAQPAKKSLTDEQKARMEENKRKALDKKRQREMEALEKAAQEARENEEDELLADFDT
jgi:hypothetical protein